MNIRLLVLGKTKPTSLESFLKDWEKKVSRFVQLEIVVLKDEKVHDDVQKVLSEEQKKLEASLRPSAALVVLDEQGKTFDSEGFAQQFEDWMNHGVSQVDMVIGSAHGIHEDLKKKADMRISLSSLTMNHQIVRLVLLEQIYRAFTLLRGIEYHK